MIIDLSINTLIENGCSLELATKLMEAKLTSTYQCNEGNFYVSKENNKVYTGTDFYRKLYFENGSLDFPYNCTELIPEYFNLALIEFVQKQKTVLGVLFDEAKQFEKFKIKEIERIKERITSQKEFLNKMKHHKFKSKENDIEICESYIDFLHTKENRLQQPKAVISDNAKNLHPKHDPNLWNNDCFDLFKYLYDCYYKNTNRQLTNIWFYLKESRENKYILKATKKQYKAFIFENYNEKITNFEKAPTKWEDKERNTINDHRINFEDSLK